MHIVGLELENEDQGIRPESHWFQVRTLSRWEVWVVEIWSLDWGQLLPSAVNQYTPTLRILSDTVFSFCDPGQRRRRKGADGRWGGGDLPEPSTLVKGNYILIPLRNLVYIWLPGTSANCLQCLSLCLLGSVCTTFFASRNTYTHRQDCRRLWLALNTTHPGVITMQVDYSNYCVNSCIFIWFFFFHSGLFSIDKLLVGLEQCHWLSSQLMWTLTPSPDPLVFVRRPRYVSKSSFLHLSVKCKKWGMLISVVGSV